MRPTPFLKLSPESRERRPPCAPGTGTCRGFASTPSRMIADGSFAATSSMSMPPDFDAITTGRRRDAVERDAEVELAVDVEGLLDEDLLDDASRGPRLRSDQRHAEDALGEVVRLLRILRELHAAALAAAPGVDLRLDDRAPAEPARDLPGLGGAVGDLTARHGDAEVREDRLGLVLVDFHGERARIIWESGPTGGRPPGRRGPSPKAPRRPRRTRRRRAAGPAG